MFCTKCGNEIPEGAKFCTSCGVALEKTAVEESAYAAEDFTEQNVPVAEMPAEPEFDLNTQGEVPQKKSKAPLWIGIGVAVAALVGLVVLILSLFGGEPEPKEQLKNAFDSSINTVFTKYDEMLAATNTVFDKAYSTTGKIRFAVNDNLMELIAPSAGIDAGALKTIIDSLAIDYQVTIDEDKLMNHAILLMEDTEIFEFAQIMDMSTGDQWFSLPTLSEQAIMLSAEMDEALSAMSMEQIQSLTKSDRLKKIASRYLAIFVDGLTAVERTTETVTVQGISQELTVLKCRLTEEDAMKMTLKLLETLKTDKEIKSLIEEAEAIIGDEESENSYESFVESIDESIAELKESENTEEETVLSQEGDIVEIDECSFDVYLSGKNFAGIYMDIPEAEAEIKALCVESEGKFGYVMVFGPDLEIHGTGENKDDGISGEFVLSVEGEEMITLVLEDVVDTVSAQSGSVAISFNKAFYEMIAEDSGDSSVASTLAILNPTLKIEQDSTKEKGSATITLMISGMDAFQIIGEGKIAEPEAITIPDNCVDAMDDEAMEQWLEDTGLYDLLEGMMGSGYSGYDDYSDYEYYY